MVNGTKDTVIFDLDGTLADVEHRRHFVKGEKKDWDAFGEACDKDTPKADIVRLAKIMRAAGYKIVICSGRMVKGIVANKTIFWLTQHGVKYDTLLMRGEGDFRPDHELKSEMLDQIGRGRVLFVVDDRNSVVKFWREAGLTCLQCAEGNF